MDWSMRESKLLMWPIFSLLDINFLQNVKLACVFGSAANEALLVTKDNEVYALGANDNGCLGIGDSRSSLLPQKVEQLCNKGISQFVFGSGPHVIGITTDGQLYSWGHNGYGQLGQGVSIIIGQGCTPERIQGVLEGVKVTKVACGGHHTLALTQGGDVYAWGYNNYGQVGSGDMTNHTTPTRVEDVLVGVGCVSVSCAQASSLALSQKGEVFTWGYNGFGHLGIGSYSNQCTPRRAQLHDVYIKEVVCGYAHVLALTDDGKLYAWGSNVYGQLGNGTKTNLLMPSQVAGDLGRFVEIAASHNSHISAATLLNQKVFMWGMCRGQSVLSPLETKFSSLDDIFACFATPSSMWRTITTEKEEARGLVKCIAERFDDVNTSDLAVIVQGKKIHVHRAILRMRCEHFYSMFQQGRWNEGQSDTIEICHFPYSIYYAFLKYLYTDRIEVSSTEEAIGILDLADSYCETDLKNKCERLICQRVTVDNAITLFAVAHKYKTQALTDQCMRFALNHMTQIVQSEAFDQLESSLAKNFVQKAAGLGAFNS
ncbi:RCC1 and BTB domain-containing protein 1-like [Halichondria panicea]|uniref:RCC1 and BTB domain-containing protein 1-like n=1 Tax=Halichondria panicea TaxID=6063 RepID=UPI00312BB71D